MTTEIFKVPDIKCEGCVKTIENAIKQIPLVESVKASFETKEVEIIGENLDRNQLEFVIIKSGYKVAE